MIVVHELAHLKEPNHDKGFYSLYANTIEPAQHARLVSIDDPYWVSSIVASIGTDPYFRWHDSGDLQSSHHLDLIVQVCLATPDTMHWLPTREYALVKQWLMNHSEGLPANLTIRLSAMFIDKPVIVPTSLKGIPGVLVSNVHSSEPIGELCDAPSRDGKCGECRACWSRDVAAISYHIH